MKAFWKVLGFAALAAGLTPYKVEKNEETGENSYQALLWRITSMSSEDGKKKDIGINLGEGTLTSKLMDAVEKRNEAHLFSDELSVEYTAGDPEEAAEEAAEAAIEAAEAATEAIDKAAEAEEAAIAAEEAAAAAEEAAAAAEEAAETYEEAAAAAEEAAEKVEE